MKWVMAPDVEIILKSILSTDIFPHVNPYGITAMRGYGSSSRAIARIWSLPRPWQMALSVTPQYIIEVIAERFDKLNDSDKEKTLIHELMHIPKSFSGSLVAHRNPGRHINSRNVDTLYAYYISRRK